MCCISYTCMLFVKLVLSFWVPYGYFFTSDIERTEMKIEASILPGNICCVWQILFLFFLFINLLFCNMGIYFKFNIEKFWGDKLYFCIRDMKVGIILINLDQLAILVMYVYVSSPIVYFCNIIFIFKANSGKSLKMCYIKFSQEMFFFSSQ